MVEDELVQSMGNLTNNRQRAQLVQLLRQEVPLLQTRVLDRRRQFPRPAYRGLACLRILDNAQNSLYWMQSQPLRVLSSHLQQRLEDIQSLLGSRRSLPRRCSNDPLIRPLVAAKTDRSAIQSYYRVHPSG